MSDTIPAYALLEALPQPLLWFDSAGSLHYANPAAQQLLPLNPEPLPCPWQRCLPPSLGEVLQEAWLAAMQQLNGQSNNIQPNHAQPKAGGVQRSWQQWRVTLQPLPTGMLLSCAPLAEVEVEAEVAAIDTAPTNTASPAGIAGEVARAKPASESPPQQALANALSPDTASADTLSPNLAGEAADSAYSDHIAHSLDAPASSDREDALSADPRYRTLYESELRQRLLVQLVFAFSYSQPLDDSLDTRYLSPEGDEFNDIGTNALMQQWSACVLFSEDKPVLAERARRLRARENVVSELRLRGPDAKVYYLLDFAFPEYDVHSRQVTQVHGAALDITHRRQAELALRRSQLLLQRVVHNTDTAIIALQALRNPEGSIVDFAWEMLNSQAELLLGYSHSALEPLRWQRDHPTMPLMPEFHGCVEVVQAGRPQVYRSHYYSPEGQKHWFKGTLTKLGEGVIITLHDISQEHLETERIRVANQELEQINSRRQQLLAMTSHELRTPLTAITGFAELLLLQMHGPLNEAQQLHTQEIVDAANHLLRIINDLLDLAKADAGRLRLNLEALELASVVRSALTMMRGNAERAQLSLRHEVPEGIILRADATRLSQMLYNLLSNAIKFTMPGGEVIVRARRREDDVVIEVADTGVGIAPEDVPKLFRNFSQLNSDSAHKGTGLGLALVRQLSALHGGMVWLESKLGKGSIFSIALPYDPSTPNEPSDET